MVSEAFERSSVAVAVAGKRTFQSFSIAVGRFTGLTRLELFSHVFCGKRSFKRSYIVGGFLTRLL